VGAGFLALLVGCSGDPAERPKAEAGPPPLGLVWKENGGAYVARLHPRTLEPLPGPRAELGRRNGWPWVFSPDRSRIAFGGPRPIRIVDARTVRVVGDAPNPFGYFDVLAWPELRRMVLVRGMEPRSVGSLAVVDPVAGRVVWRRPVAGTVVDFARTEDGLVLLLGPSSGIEGARLAVVTPGAGVRLVRLGRVQAGIRAQSLDGRHSVDHYRTPGIAVDPGRQRAYVVSAADEVADVDLRSLRVTYHALEEQKSIRERVQNWLEPAAEAKRASEGWLRRALWLGNGTLAVVGWDDRAYFDDEGYQQQVTEAAGLVLVDVRRWSKHVLDLDATSASLVGDFLLAYGSRWNSAEGRFAGSGLTVYDRSGRESIHLFDDEPVGMAEVSGAFAYAWFEDPANCRGSVVHLETGRLRELGRRAACNRPELLDPP
jgi:hypothetical protein